MPSAAPNPTPKPTISVGEAFQALDRINKSTTWLGANARQLESIASMSSDDWRRAVEVFHVNRSRRSWWILAAVTLGAFVFFVTDPSIASGVVLVVLAGAVAYQEGQNTGRADGYEAGHRAGIYKAAGLTDDEAREMPGWAIRMEVEERAARALANPPKK